MSSAFEQLVARDETAAQLYAEVCRAVAGLGEAGMRPGRSQVAFRRRRTFAAVWMPRQYLGRGAPLVLTIYLPARDPSPRFKEVVEPAPGRFTHHLELRGPGDVDEEVLGWLRRAWEAAV